MATKEKLEEKILQTERKLNEFSIKLKQLDDEYEQLLEQLSLNPKQLKEHIENPENFTPEVWEYLQNEMKKWDEKLNLELKCVPDLNKIKKTTAERGNVQQHWLFVR